MSCIKPRTSQTVEVLDVDLRRASALNLLSEEYLKPLIIVIHLCHLGSERTSGLVMSIEPAESSHRDIGRLTVPENSYESLHRIAARTNGLLIQNCVIPRIGKLDGLVEGDTIRRERNTRGFESLGIYCNRLTGCRTRDTRVIANLLHTC